ncbi:acetylglutamate kinase [Thermaerobacter sp. PB12/4term]|uniref:acetylglutamate kinase n=1 Tax=Thermaerobacter sp. PB12/4term TaxID=2293838 RepID=UPI000E32C64F|nr:acetylglutamate kinase [Thermaerobacter sp. PB12/4term]QIA26542.1 acetylglutamate kinase [Thermaerobacter sp. PB12/4term]
MALEALREGTVEQAGGGGQAGLAAPGLPAEVKAAVLTDVLPWVQRFAGRIVVVKHGGSTLGLAPGRAPVPGRGPAPGPGAAGPAPAPGSPSSWEQAPGGRGFGGPGRAPAPEGAAAIPAAPICGGDAVLQDIAMLRALGVRPVVVHGGGKAITAWLDRLDLPARFVDGLRVTDTATLAVVEMVLAGQVNKALVTGLNQAAGRPLAVGLSGCDAGLLQARPKRPGGRDIGFVGEIVAVNTAFLEQLLGAGFVPVIAPLAVGEGGVRYNVNADDAAAAVAGALGAEKLVFLTDVPGVMADRDGDGRPETLSSLDAATARELIARGEIRGGMVPKVQAGLRALAAGAGSVHIIDGRRPHALLVELFTSEGVGTMVVAQGEERGA